jgi:hypothetical protein
VVRGHKTAGRLPERSEEISGNERSGLTPIAAEDSKVPDMADARSEQGPIPKVRPYRLAGVLQLLRRRPER